MDDVTKAIENAKNDKDTAEVENLALDKILKICADIPSDRALVALSSVQAVLISETANGNKERADFILKLSLDLTSDFLDSLMESYGAH